MEILKKLVDIVLHMSKHLDELVAQFGPWLYVILFLIIFCETGLVVTPFLPGDSLLFAVGALARPARVDSAFGSLLVHSDPGGHHGRLGELLDRENVRATSCRRNFRG
jgi:membrane-associated protein